MNPDRTRRWENHMMIGLWATCGTLCMSFRHLTVFDKSEQGGSSTPSKRFFAARYVTAV